MEFGHSSPSWASFWSPQILVLLVGKWTLQKIKKKRDGKMLKLKKEKHLGREYLYRYI
jgi:hypothetical protein